MCSLVSEDLVASKLQVMGPRGVTYSDGTAGATNNYQGRFPKFNYYNTWPVCYWGTTPETASRSYSTNYAFGAYLARNFGGAAFFKNVVQNSYTNYLAIENELTVSGETFADVLRKWGAALLLSNSLSPPSGYYQYNQGGFFASIIGSITYSLGSINQFNYRQYDGTTWYTTTGPYIFTVLDSATTLQDGSSVQHGTSNISYAAGTAATGTKNWTLHLENNVLLTVVVK
jgi:hypothetical protein